MPIFYAVLPEGAEITGTDFCSSRLHTAFTLLAYMCFLRYVLSCCTALWWKLELLFIIYAAFLENIYFAPVLVLNAHHPTVQNFHKIFTSKHHNVPHVGHITLQSVWLRTFPLMAESFFILKCIKKKEQNEPKNKQININRGRSEHMHQCYVYLLHFFSLKKKMSEQKPDISSSPYNTSLPHSSLPTKSLLLAAGSSVYGLLVSS